MSYTVDNEREEFMKNAFFVSAWRDTSQHVTIYKDADEKTKSEFRKYLNKRTYEIIEKYKEKQVSSEEHTKLIEKLYNEIKTNDVYKDKVNFSFGRTQKLVNVLLKYYWCADKLNGHEPAHLPLDRYILKELGCSNTINWTQMDYFKYIECIKKADEKAKEKGKSLSEWELIKYAELTRQD